MAIVKKAVDTQTGKHCAIKRMKTSVVDELRWKESFNREFAALSELSGHENIVALLDAGTDERGFYMVLEWINHNLVDWVNRKGPISWNEFYPSLGRPILDALVFAQGRSWNHRDIKPQNVLITDNGVPKISDYGIAKHIERPRLGLTFNHFRSAPFTPPEDDNGVWSKSRDCFSWAAVAIYCLTGKIPEDYGALTEMAASLDETSVPIPILHHALSMDPSERHSTASILLAELDTFWASQQAARRPRRKCHIQFDPSILNYILRQIDGSDRHDAEAFVLQELNEVDVGIRAIAAPNSAERALRIWAVSWSFEVCRSPQKDRLVIRRALPMKSSEVELNREESFRVPLEFTFASPSATEQYITDLNELILEVDSFEIESRDQLLLAQRERVFRVWYAFLRAKADFEAKRENAISFVDCKIMGNSVVLTTEMPAPAEIIGQSRLVRNASGSHVFCDILDVNLDEVVVVVTSGNVDRFPRRGRLELNTVAAERSIERQRRALDAINYDRAASVRLKGLLIDPGAARPPMPVSVSKIGGGPFDSEKHTILRQALGTQDVLAIQGPPGTGKTRLIEEIIVQYLILHPHRRVLLSSQTHVALDNVIDRVRSREKDIEIVRIGRIDDPKISERCRDLILDRKASAWAERVRADAHSYLTAWAEQRGIDRTNIEIGMLAERLILLLQQRSRFAMDFDVAKRRVRAVEDREEAKLNETGSAESADITAASVEAQQAAGELRSILAGIEEQVEEVRCRLRAAGGYGIELAEQTEETELRDWSTMLLGEGDEQRRFRSLLELQEEWMLRVGRSSEFHAAILSSAQVVAGTCIGMASVRGMGDVVYDLCIVDEASKATATEILVPMARSRTWILVGDPAQLPPFFEDDSITQISDFDEAEVRETILDRFIRGLPNHSQASLTNQHRMVKPIGDMISYAFYDQRLISPRIKQEITLPGAFPKPITWLSSSQARDSREVRRGQSFYNDAECRIVRNALARIDFLARKRKAVYSVALIAGYVAQVKALQDAIRDNLHEWSGLKITCSTVDAFQGSEAEICIYSVTRSNKEGNLGFLREKPRLNVALSRGRSSLIIVGDDEFCRPIEGENPFRRILDYMALHPDQCERRIAE